MPRRVLRLALAACLGAGVVAAVPSQADHPARRLPTPVKDPLTSQAGVPELVASGLSPLEAGAVLAKRALLSMGVARATFERAGDPAAPCDLVTAQPQGLSGTSSQELPLGDLDGDKRRDLLELHDVMQGKTVTGYLSARDARTGRALWTVTRDLTSASNTPVQADYHFLSAVPSAVGVPARPGVLQVRVDLGFTTVGTTTRVSIGYDLTGLDRRGRSSWHASFAGSYTVVRAGDTTTFTYDDLPTAVVFGRFRAAAADLVVKQVSTVPTGTRTTVRRFALDTGAITTPYGAQPAGPLSPVTDLLLPNEEIGAIGVAPDQNGDRRPDLYQVVYLSPSAPVSAQVGGSSTTLAQVRVYRGDNGDPLWQSLPFAPTGTISVLDAGVLSQQESKVHDLAVVQNTFGFSLGGGGSTTDRKDGSVTLLEGGSGNLLWALPGTELFPMDRYQGVPGVGVASLSAPVGGDGSTVQLDVEVHDASGKVLGSNAHVVDVSTTCSWFLYRLIPGIDLTHDGARDAVLSTVLFSDAPPTSGYRLALDGRSGKALDRLDTGFLSASLNGGGVTRVTTSEHARDDTYLLRRGDKVTSVLLKLVLAKPTKDSYTYVDTVLGTGGRCADVTTYVVSPVTVAGKPAARQVIALLGANGKPWWTLTVDPAHPQGVLKTGKGAKNLC